MHFKKYLWIASVNGYMKDKNNNPWVEKYRPTDFSQIVLESYNRKIFENIIEKDRFPHLLFYGPPGVGKTTTAENLIRNYQKKKKKVSSENVIHLNASDDRGIEVIRNQIHQFVKSKNMFDVGYKFVILDEVDYMTKNAQQALKNLLQNSNPNVRFCLICNYICKIEESLKNEFICVRFNNLPSDEIVTFMRTIAVQENLNIDDNTIRLIQNVYNSDIRSMVNFLQLHQGNTNWEECLLNNDYLQKLHVLFVENKIDGVFAWFHNVTLLWDFQTCAKKYFNYMIINQQRYVTVEFLNIAEVILHSTDVDEYAFQYFVREIANHYKIENEYTKKGVR